MAGEREEGAVASDVPLAATSAKMEESEPEDRSPVVGDDIKREKSATKQVVEQRGESTSESDEMVPKAAHDATSANVAA